MTQPAPHTTSNTSPNPEDATATAQEWQAAQALVAHLDALWDQYQAGEITAEQYKAAQDAALA